MALYGGAVQTENGTRFFVIEADDAEQALSNFHDATDCPKENIQVFLFEELLQDQYGGFAELSSI